MRRSASFLLAAAGLGLGGWALHARAQTAPAPSARSVPSDTQRWQASLDAFADDDRLHAPATGGVLFVGSSSIRLWDGLEQAFVQPARAVLKRGFGGSRMADVAALADRLVLPYRPRLVVVYAGDNDLAEGRTPQQVLESFDSLVGQVRQALPGTRIAYVSIKPSPLRAALMPAVRETNALIAEHARTTPGLDYIDVFTPMLGADGRPRAELFREDALHLNEAGYALWREVIASHLPATGAAPLAVTTSAAR